jgi:tetratricopeptide (TPR) repeat protein
MKLNVIKATLVVAFLVLTGWLTYIGLNKKEASIDFKALEKKRSEAMNEQNLVSFDNIIKNIGNSTRLVKPDILASADTTRLSLAIQLLDSNKQYSYAGVLSEKIAAMQHSAHRYFMAARYFLMQTYSHTDPLNEIMFIKRSKYNLEKSLDINPENLDAKVDLAICTHNINKIQTPENQMDLMKPALLLREVVKVDPDHVDAIYYLGKLSVESGQLEKGIERFKKLVSLQPQNPEFYMELSKTYELMGNTKEAKEWADKARDLNSLK